MGRRLPEEADRKGGSSCSFSEACGHSSESALVRVRSSGQLPELVEAIAAIGDSCVDNGGPHHQADYRLFHRFRIGRDANFWRRRLKSARPESRLPVVPSSYLQPVRRLFTPRRLRAVDEKPRVIRGVTAREERTAKQHDCPAVWVKVRSLSPTRVRCGSGGPAPLPSQLGNNGSRSFSAGQGSAAPAKSE
jgi:hypothetical protein